MEILIEWPLTDVLKVAMSVEPIKMETAADDIAGPPNGGPSNDTQQPQVPQAMTPPATAWTSVLIKHWFQHCFNVLFGSLHDLVHYTFSVILLWERVFCL